MTDWVVAKRGGEAKDRVGRNDRLSPGGERKQVKRQGKGGPSWKVARVQPKGTQNDGFSPSFLPLPPVSVFHFLPPWLIRFTAPCLFFPGVCALLSFLALVAFGVGTFLTLLAFLAFLALFAFVCNISIGRTRGFAFP